MAKHNFKIIIRSDVPRADGTSLLCLQTFIDKKRLVFSLGIYVLPDQFDKSLQRVVHGTDKSVLTKILKGYNDVINHSVSRAHNILFKYQVNNRPLTAEAFKREFSQEELNHDFIAFMRDEITKMGTLRERGTLNKYKQTIAKMLAYMPSVSFGMLCYDWVCGFDAFLAGKNLCMNTRNKHHKTIHAFINLAIKKGVFITDPYEHFKMSQVKGYREHLNSAEVDLLYSIYCNQKLPGEQLNVLHYFLFSCFTGLRDSDLRVISTENIIDNKLVFVPIKTKRFQKIMQVPMNETAKSLIHVQIGKLFKVLTNQATNRALKVICEAAGIKKNVTIHVARHTFATQFIRRGGSVVVLKELMGHCSIETTMIYVHMCKEQQQEQLLLMDGIVNDTKNKQPLHIVNAAAKV